MPLDRRMDLKMWYIYTMEYYTAEKINDILNFARKHMELENIILSWYPNTERQISFVTHRWFLNIKKTSLKNTIPENLDNNQATKRDLHRSNLLGSRK